MSSALQSKPPTRIRARIERRTHVEVELEIPAGTPAFAVKGTVIIDAGVRGFMTASEAVRHGLVKIVEPSTTCQIPELCS
jgi:hypothetical protein